MPYAECSECSRAAGNGPNECETLHRAETKSRISPLCCECMQSAARKKGSFKGPQMDKWTWATGSCSCCRKRKFNKCKGQFAKRTLSQLCICGLTEAEHSQMAFQQGLNAPMLKRAEASNAQDNLTVQTGDSANHSPVRNNPFRQNQFDCQPSPVPSNVPSNAPNVASQQPVSSFNPTHKVRLDVRLQEDATPKESKATPSSPGFVDIPTDSWSKGFPVDPSTEGIEQTKALTQTMIQAAVLTCDDTEKLKNARAFEEIIEQQKQYITQLERDCSGLQEKLLFRNTANAQAEGQSNAEIALLRDENANLRVRCTEVQRHRDILENRLMQERMEKDGAIHRCQAVEQQMESSVQHVVNVVSEEKRRLKEALTAQQFQFAEDQKHLLSRIKALEDAAMVRENERANLARMLRNADGHSATGREEMETEAARSVKEYEIASHLTARLRERVEVAEARDSALTEMGQRIQAAAGALGEFSAQRAALQGDARELQGKNEDLLRELAVMKEAP
eukprot:CAMPEP_0181288894 /NCGR_PEP_ID=MMETSP1101-20121128/590_1 /TAXON_ID=46948 /ORGANISM="Rhodomonas abbreviata, Strain Caron Lab Isolate" /LENGTH=506 /DNA_ID=CAMNT_0023393075 /DNA_START=38 /DNA_END=1555 /DNA_ORIENTATION=-